MEPPTDQIARPVLTDDWPYLYVDPSVVDWTYLSIVAIILLISTCLARNTLWQAGTTWNYWQMFFLGAAFLLIELASIARLSLLFGSTWITAAIVINCILAMLLLSNLYAIKVQGKFNTHIVYALLFAGILGSYLLPVDQLAEQASRYGPAGYLVIASITLSPVLAAGLIFPQALAAAASAPKALTFNVLGGVVGGLMEYASYFTGTSGLILISGLLYLASFICCTINARHTGTGVSRTKVEIA